jgi:hypothetical protein
LKGLGPSSRLCFDPVADLFAVLSYCVGVQPGDGSSWIISRRTRWSVSARRSLRPAASQPALPAAPQPRYQTRLNRTLDGIRSFRQSFVNDETKGQVHPMRPALQAGKHRPAASVLRRRLSSGRLSCTERKPPAPGAAARCGSRPYPRARLASA